MHWFGVIAISVVAVLALVWLRATPRGTRKLRGTRLMVAGQYVLAAAALIILIAGLARGCPPDTS